jgi:hypothetical protein
MARDTGFESVGFNGVSRTFASSEAHLRAPSRATLPPASGVSRKVECDLPSPLACFVEATAKLAGQAVERGALEEARGLLAQAIRSIDATESRPVAGLRVVAVGGEE